MKAIKKLWKYIRKIGDGVRDDYISAFSAQTAFYIMLSFVPFVILFLTMAKLLPYTQADFTRVLVSVVPAELHPYAISIVNDLYRKANGTVVSISGVTALWSASRGIMSLSNGLNVVYKIKETRNYLVIRGIAMLYTFFMVLALILVLVLFVFGNSLYDVIVVYAPFLNDLADLVIHIRTAVAIVVFTLFFMVVYKVLPNTKIRFRKVWPGAVFTSVTWVALSFLFSIYIEMFTNFSYMYGSLAGIAIAMLWLYTSMYLIFLGAEMNYHLDSE